MNRARAHTANRLGLTEHSLRPALLHEAHARPFEVLEAPLHVSHLALYTGTDSASQEAEHVARLCQRLGVERPAEGSSHCVVEAPGFRLRWERHTEFSTYTLFVPDPRNAPFALRAVDLAPQGWVAQLPGELLAASHLSLVPEDAVGSRADALARWFDRDALAGSLCAGGAASVWTDFRSGDDGFTRFVVLDRGLRPSQAGRLVQRLLEIETYRMMALLAFPTARELGPQIGSMETQLGDLTDRMAEVQALSDEQALLGALSRLSAEVEHTMARTNFRFSATEAYGSLVRRRIDALREQRIEGVSTLAEFMERRFAPALATCSYIRDRLDRLSRRVSRAANLLRTRVDVALEAQNRDLLKSMNRRARLQLRLQETVEGLSIVILSYYTVSLVGYAAKGLKGAGFPVPVDVVTGLSIPAVAAIVAIGILRLRRGVEKADNGD
ncbi:DUF3422 family protein [Arhodomonas sp. AD133]|uniref:DUF3422 family protein n=1 Tax=Arhodomonas sp. AD133 TaxID=3415009 RepID=UPI003EBA5612